MTEEWHEADMIVASTTAFESRYGPWQFEPEQLHRLAAQMNRAQAGMVLNHDPSQVFRTRNEIAHVRFRDDGVAELVVTCLVHAGDYDAWMQQLRDRAAPGGMSVAVTNPLAEPEESPAFSLIGDAADFSGEVLLQLAEEAPAPTGVFQMYQFAAGPEAVRMVLGFVMSVVSDVPSNLVADWITKAMSALRRKATEDGRPAALDVDIVKVNGDSVRIRYEPRSDEAAVQIVETVMGRLFPED